MLNVVEIRSLLGVDASAMRRVYSSKESATNAHQDHLRTLSRIFVALAPKTAQSVLV